ncbi:MAG: adventurous gliding motility protein U, partial [Pseudobdellovibrionaceae bacterium]
MPVKSSWIFFLIPLLMNVTAWSKNKETTKGLLPEIRLDQNNESNNESKAIQSEMLITATEEKALTALQKIIKNKKGSPEEADLWYRMAELQMRRSKSGRFFDLYQDSAYLKNTTFPAAKSSSKESIRKAIEIYNKIEKDFPKYKEMDSVLFNNAFAHQQLNLKNVAIELYSKMLQKYPKSELTPDATLAVGELYYEQQKFALALSYFEKIDQFPEAKVYFYGLYKTAWANYNLKQTPQGIKKLVQLIQLTPSAEALKQNSAVNSSLLQKHKHNLRKEALRDLVVFVGDELATKDTYSFFKKICTDSELAQAMVDLSQLYISHSKFKDIPIFLNEYIEKNPMGSGVVRSHLFIAETAETIKNRNGVIEQLLIVEKLCSPSSDWQKNQDQENLKMSCEDKFKSLRQELASKWWDIWQKNKKHAEFSGWTQKILELSIRQEPTNQPDIKTHYAYAELLFQTNQFIESSQEYEKIFNLTKEEPLRHDSLYSALFSVEKFLDSNDKNKSASHLQKRNFLGETYLQNYPEGLYADQVQFKLALVDYENKKLSSALERLNKVGEKDLELSTKSQDLILDIYNIQKNYNQIIAITTDILKKEKNLQRKSSLQQIQQESELAIAQNLSDTGKKQQASKALIEFGKKYPDSKLASQAQWQAIGLLFSEGQLQSAADQCWAFAKKYQKENKDKAYEAANEAIKAYIKLSQLQTAAEILENLATNIEFDKNSKLEEKTKNLELAADFYWLEGKNEKAQTIYKKILAKAPSKTWGTLYDKILLTETNPQRLETLKNEIVQKNIEPLATQYLTEKAQ